LGLREIGVYAAVAAPVYLSPARSGPLLRELQKLVGLRDGPFLLLTPTGSSWTPEVEAMARPYGAGHIALSSVLQLEGTTSPQPSPPAERVMFTRNASVEPMLAEFARRVASLRRGSGTLLNIHREIAAVRKDFGELRSAKQRLEKMVADGVFGFTAKVDATSFKVLCTIL